MPRAFGSHIMPTEDRFMRHVYADPNCGCWLWGGANDGDKGYGRFRDDTGKSVQAHRFAYEHFTGDRIPSGMIIDHKCLLPACVNPRHLEPVTPRENVLRNVRSGVTYDLTKGLRKRTYGSKTHCARGHQYTNPIVSTATGWRRCRTCWNIRQVARANRKKRGAR